MALSVIVLDKNEKVVGETKISGGFTEVIRNHRGKKGKRIIITGELYQADIESLQRHLYDLKPCFGMPKKLLGKEYVKPADGVEITTFKPEDEQS